MVLKQRQPAFHGAAGPRCRQEHPGRRALGPILRRGGLLLGAFGAVLLVGCLKTPAPAQEVHEFTAGIVPALATLTTGRTMTFSSSFGGGTSGPVSWKVLEPGGGTVDTQGTYTAPHRAGVYTLYADFGGARAAKATLTVVAPPRSELSAPDRVMPEAMGLTAQIAPTPGGTYAWTMTGGYITQGHTGPAITFQAGTSGKVVMTCKATNLAGDAVNSTLEVPIALPVTVGIRPTQVTITQGGTMKFGYSIQGGTSLRVAWSLAEPGAGTLDAQGNYSAPAVPGFYSVRVSSVDDPMAHAIAKVKVVAAPPQDLFASASFPPGAGGLLARATAVEGITYAWTIEGGTITEGAASSSVVFTAGDGPTLVLRCTMTNGAGDSYLAVKALTAR